MESLHANAGSPAPASEVPRGRCGTPHGPTAWRSRSPRRSSGGGPTRGSPGSDLPSGGGREGGALPPPEASPLRPAPPATLPPERLSLDAARRPRARREVRPGRARRAAWRPGGGRHAGPTRGHRCLRRGGGPARAPRQRCSRGRSRRLRTDRVLPGLSVHFVLRAACLGRAEGGIP